MPAGRILKYCIAVSVLFHLALFLLASVIPYAPRRDEDVMVVDLADLPRSTDFLPPKPGVIEGAKPKSPPDRPRQKEKPPDVRREVLRGQVPDLPVNPTLPPEKEFPAQPAQKEPPPRPAEPPAQTARAERPQDAKPAAPAKDARGAAKGGPVKSLRDLTPSFSQTFLAMKDRGSGRGRNGSSGDAVGTEAKARETGEFSEEGGTSARLTALNAPEIQYISYFAGIKRKIDLVWQYPYDAMVAGIQGDLIIVFVIGRDGRLESVDLLRGSGHKILDDEALRSIRAAAPFDPIPADYGIPNLRVQGHFIYGGVHNVRFR